MSKIIGAGYISTLEAAKVIDRFLLSKERATTYTDFLAGEKGDEAELQEKLSFLESQFLQEFASVSPKYVLQIKLEKMEWLMLFLAFLLFVFSYILAYPHTETKNSRESKEIAKLLEDVKVPESVKEKLEKLKDALDTKDLSDPDVYEALSEANDALVIEQQGSELLEGEEAQNMDGQRGSTGGLATPTPTLTPTQSVEEKKEDGGKSDASEGNSSSSSSANKSGKDGEGKGDSNSEKGGKKGEKGDGGDSESDSNRQDSRGGSEGKKNDKGGGTENENGDESKNGGSSGENKEDRQKGPSKGEKRDDALKRAEKVLNGIEEAIKKEKEGEKKEDEGKKEEDGKEGDKKEEKNEGKKEGGNKEGEGGASGEPKKGEERREGKEKDKESGVGKEGGNTSSKKSEGEGEKGEGEKSSKNSDSMKKKGEEKSDRAREGEKGEGASLEQNPEAMKELVEDGKSGEMPGGSKGFKEVQIKTGDEKLDTRFKEQSGKLVENKEAKSKLGIEDLSLPKSEPDKAKLEQRIPLEYKDILREK